MAMSRIDVDGMNEQKGAIGEVDDGIGCRT